MHRIAAALLVLLAAPAFAQNIGQTVDVGGWKVRRVQGEGATQTCIAVQAAEDNTAVGFGVTNQGQAFLMLLDSTGKMKPGQEVALEYKVDSGKTAKAISTAVNPSTLIAPLGGLKDVDPFFNAVEAGSNIHLETPDFTFDYTLKGSKAAMAVLATCLQASMTP